MGAPVVHFEITGKDVKKLQSFYSELFDWRINSDNPMNYGMIDAQTEKSIGGGIAEAAKGSPSHATFYVEVADPRLVLKKAEKMGGKIVVPVTEIPNMVTFAMFTDPEGHLIGLVKSM
ncbi:MAG: VOC family protein [Calditrichaceae bacterium]